MLFFVFVAGCARAPRLMVHMRVSSSRPPLKDREGLVSWTIDMEVGVSTALYPLSTNCAMESNALLPMSGKM